ncbi:MAG: M61 family metallopeptidase [Gemmatimonadales bacterium]
MNPLILSAFAAALSLGASPAPAVAHPTVAPTVDYVVSVSQPETHMFHVRMEITGVNDAAVDVSMPVWTPGSYLVREYERHVTTFAADDGNGGEFAWHKIDKNTWRIETGGAERVIVEYQVYGREPGIRWSFVYAEGGHILGPSLFMYVVGLTDLPTSARFELPEGWRLDGGIRPSPDDPFLVVAKSYHQLIDTPMLIGHFDDVAFEVNGVPHAILILGSNNADLEQLSADFTKIVETDAELFDGLPYDRYALIYMTVTGGGGIEHANGTTIGLGNVDFTDPRSRRRILGTTSHEFFHTWNVKRIQPPAFRPYNYEEENYTDALWFYEGFTSYYGERVLYRAGLIDSLSDPVEMVTRYKSSPGNRNESPAAASFNAWIHYYRRDESSANYRSNYYFLGSVIANLLELEIADRTDGDKGLDDVMRYIWQKTRDDGAAFDAHAIRKACEQVAGGSFEQFFDDYVFGTHDIPFERFFALAGYDLVVDEAATADRDRSGYLGVATRASGNGLRVTRVTVGSPAWRDGVSYGDVILSIGSTTVNGTRSLTAALNRYRPGQQVALGISRLGRNEMLDVTLGEHPVPVYRMIETDNPSAKQLAVRRRWRMGG